MTIGDIITALAPEFILLAAAMVALLAGVLRAGRVSRVVAPLTFLAVVGALVVSVRQGHPDTTAVTGIGLLLTPLTFYTRCVALGVGSLIVLVNWHQPIARERGEYMAMILLSLLGVLLTASANDLIVLFLAIELVSVPTYVLIALSRDDQRSSEATVKYFFLGALSAAILAYGLSFLYGASGTTAMYTISDSVAVSNLPSSQSLGPIGLVGLLLVFAGLLFKIAAAPFHVYAADVYEGAASPVTGLLGFVPKFAGFLALIKVFAACDWALPPALMWMIWVVAVATMTIGNTLALLQKNTKRILAYSSVSHTGYMLIGLLVGPVAGAGPLHNGITALLFYMAVYGVMNLGAFAFLGAFKIGGRDVETLDDLSGMATHVPAAALGLAVCVFSLMGFPPTAGLMGKMYLLSGAFSIGEGHVFAGPLFALVIIAVLNSAVGAVYYLRIVYATYVVKSVEAPKACGGAPIRLGLAVCALAMLGFFAWPGGLVRRARSAAVMLSPSLQITDVRPTKPQDAEPGFRDADVNSGAPGATAVTAADHTRSAVESALPTSSQ